MLKRGAILIVWAVVGVILASAYTSVLIATSAVAEIAGISSWFGEAAAILLLAGLSFLTCRSIPDSIVTDRWETAALGVGLLAPAVSAALSGMWGPATLFFVSWIGVLVGGWLGMTRRFDTRLTHASSRTPGARMIRER